MSRQDALADALWNTVKRKAMTPERLAESLGVELTLVNDVLMGKPCSEEDVARLAEALQRDGDDLLADATALERERSEAADEGAPEAEDVLDVRGLSEDVKDALRALVNALKAKAGP